MEQAENLEPNVTGHVPAQLEALRMTQGVLERMIRELAERLNRQGTAPELLTAAEVAAKLRLSRWRFYHIYRQIGLLPVRRFGRRLLFRREDVRRVVQSRRAPRGRPPRRL
ncbi:MAG: helix-turn-helix domain-containing protein [Elusimicrobiota bacterium]